MNYEFIDSDEKLAELCGHLSDEPIIGCDLEADAMHAFKEKICLIQIAAGNRAFLVDPFAVTDLTPFKHILENPSIIKIFHGADFDIRSLDREMGVRMQNLFDTEIACRFLNIKERGLGALLLHYFDVFVDKKFQKVDWSRRPLKTDMIEYSVGDVAHLIDLYRILKEKLSDLNRLHWAKEEFEALTRVRYESNHTLPLFKKFKGAGKLDNRSLAVLENLLSLRLQMARKKDVPAFKIMSNQSIMAMTAKRPQTVSDMLADKLLSRRQADMYGKLCCRAVGEAMALSRKQLPSYPRTVMPRKSPTVVARIKQLKKMREKKSEDIGMEPGFLINNGTLSAIAFEPPATRTDLGNMKAVRNWQAEAIGEDILKTLKRCR